MKESSIWAIIIKDYEKLREKNYYIKHLRESFIRYNLDTLKQSWKAIKTSFKDYKETEFLKILYKAYSISTILNRKTLNLEQCIYALKAAFYIQTHYPSSFVAQETLDKLIPLLQTSISNCDSFDSIVYFWGLLQRIEPNVYAPIVKSIEERLACIVYADNIVNLKEKWKSIIKFEPDEKTELEWIISIVEKASVLWIENESKRLGNSDEESLEAFKNNSNELTNFIDIIKLKNENKHSKIDNEMGTLLRERGDETDHENYGSTSHIDEFEKEKLVSYKISFSEKIESISVNSEEEQIISTFKGTLDKSTSVSIKVYQQKRNEPPNLFLKELELHKKLSEKSQYFLEYKGWFQELPNTRNPEAHSIYGVVTEIFENTLMDEIIYRCHNNIKFSYQEYQEIVCDLLEGFAYLESIGITHNTIKPHNILITANWKLKISWFSLSDLSEMSSLDLDPNKSENIWKGNYNAPEITEFYNERRKIPNENFEKCDIFSLGLVFLQMYSLLPISELNTPLFWSEIDDYVSTFKPKNVANLLRKMLAINSTKRASFKESLEIFSFKEENKNEREETHGKIMTKINYSNPLIDASNYLNDLELINASLIDFYQEPYDQKQLSKEVTIEYHKGTYEDKTLLIRTYRSQDFKKLLPYVKEAKLLKKLNGAHPSFLGYYYSIYSFKNSHEFSIVTEWCCESLMSEITYRRNHKIKYSENELINYATTLFELIALKNNGCYHLNIKPHNIVRNMHKEITITGFYIPKAKIYSECKFPENKDDFIQNEEGYSSPETRNTKQLAVEKFDAFSLGLVLLQMMTLESVANWGGMSSEELKRICPGWLLATLRKMLSFKAEMREDLEKSFKDMKSFYNTYKNMRKNKQ